MLHKTGAWVSVTGQGLSLFQPFCSPNSEVWKASSLGGRGQPALEAVLPAAFHQQEVAHICHGHASYLSPLLLILSQLTPHQALARNPISQFASKPWDLQESEPSASQQIAAHIPPRCPCGYTPPPHLPLAVKHHPEPNNLKL